MACTYSLRCLPISISPSVQSKHPRCSHSPKAKDVRTTTVACLAFSGPTFTIMSETAVNGVQPLTYDIDLVIGADRLVRPLVLETRWWRHRVRHVGL